MNKQWACRCHGRPYIHAALELPFDLKQWQWATNAAQHAVDTYRSNPKANSVYTPGIKRARRGWLAERVLAQAWGRKMASYRRPWEVPYDVSPDIEVRASEHPFRDALEFQYLSLTLYPKDKKKVRSRKWVFASVCEAEEHVHYHGYRDGADIRLHAPETVYMGKFPSTIIGRVYVDEMSDIEDLR